MYLNISHDFLKNKKPSYDRGTKTLLGNKPGNIRKQIFDFWEQGNKPTKE